MRAALYARRSKPPKGWVPSYPGEVAPGSTDAQLAKLQAWAKTAGHEVILQEHDTATGKNPNRPGWQRIMAAVKGGHVQVVAITRTSRAMRNSKHYLEVVEVFLERNCIMEVLEQPMASVRGRGDPMAVAFRTVAAAFNQLEVDLHDEQSNEVLERREDGKLYGPRSDKPAGRPVEFGPEHKFRVRGGSRRHDRANCRVCHGQTGGPDGSESDPPQPEGVANPPGLAMGVEGP